MGVVMCGRGKGEKKGIAEATSAGKQPSSRNFLQFSATRNDLEPKARARLYGNRGRRVGEQNVEKAKRNPTGSFGRLRGVVEASFYEGLIIEVSLR